MKTVFTFAIALITTFISGQTDPSLTMDDLQILNNTHWDGTLTYLNYGDNREVTLKTKLDLNVKNGKLHMHTQYVDEPSANSKSAIKLKKNGTYFGNEKIISKSISEAGQVTLVTAYDGKDANKPATITKTYIYDGQSFSVTKEVQFKDSPERFVRNAYNYTKSN